MIDREVRGRQGERTDLVDNINEVVRPDGTSRQHALRRLRKDRPYGSLDALLKAEIGADVKESCEIVRLRSNGGDRRSENFQSNNITLKTRGTAADYLTARIARDNPDILQRMKAGEFKSVRQAANAKTTSHFLYAALRRAFSSECSDALRCLLNAQDTARSVALYCGPPEDGSAVSSSVGSAGSLRFGFGFSSSGLNS